VVPVEWVDRATVSGFRHQRQRPAVAIALAGFRPVADAERTAGSVESLDGSSGEELPTTVGEEGTER